MGAPFGTSAINEPRRIETMKDVEETFGPILDNARYNEALKILKRLKESDLVLTVKAKEKKQ